MSIALLYGIGLALVTMEMAALSFFGIRFSASSIALAALPVLAASFILLRRYEKNVGAGVKKGAAGPSFFAFEVFLVSAIAFMVFYAFFKALIKPIESYDAVAIYGLQSKIFYLAGGIPRDYYTAFSGFVPHIEYPLLVPLAETLFYNLIGSWNDQLVKVIFPLYYAAILVVLYSVLRRMLGRRESLLFTFLLASIPQFHEYGTNAYADLVLAFYYSLSIFYLFLWIKEGFAGHLVVSCVLSILSAWAKTEGMMLIAVNMLVMLIYIAGEGRKRLRGGLFYIIFLLAAVAVFALLKRMLGISMHGNFAEKGMFDPLRLVSNLKRIPVILYQFQIQFFGPKKWNIIWILFLAGFFLNLKAAFRGPVRYLTLWLLFIMCGYSIVYIVIPGDINWIIARNLSRFFLHFTPAAVLWLAVMFKELKLKI